MQRSSSLQSKEQPRSPKPSISPSDSQNLSYASVNQSQVYAIDAALNTAKVLSRVKKDRFAKDLRTVERQILERTLQNNLERRLSSISLPSSPQEDFVTPNHSLLPDLLPLEPRTSSPNVSLSNPLAPGTPTSPAGEDFNSVFFPKDSNLPEPIQTVVLESATESDSPPKESILAVKMAELQAKEDNLKKLGRKITAIMDSNPADVLIEPEMIPLYVEVERKMVDQFIDFN